MNGMQENTRLASSVAAILSYCKMYSDLICMNQELQKKKIIKVTYLNFHGT